MDVCLMEWQLYISFGFSTCCVVLVLCFLYAVPCGGSSIELTTSGSGPVGPGSEGRHSTPSDDVVSALFVQIWLLPVEEFHLRYEVSSLLIAHILGQNILSHIFQHVGKLRFHVCGHQMIICQYLIDR